MLTAIAAVSSEWGIGKDGDLLFNIPDDKKFFRVSTLNHTIIMGRKTLQSLPNSKPLPKRRNIVLSHSLKGCEGVEAYGNIGELLKHVSINEESFVIGGGEVYSELLPYCNKAIITKINKSVEADTYFPNLDNDKEWVLSECSELFTFEDLAYTFCTYKRISNPCVL